ncbi:hypothetical protein L1987_17405 [Smallanthus sonchifolius]|uniref:Uncharacterized protein n=1 Tax=Smallanthus sonchifolius TaxID=185202 RepID=A0ACB9IWT6_9ASTR|nr:hypothetical protein L1987_17405 [Smallanthus sonchifolius]
MSYYPKPKTDIAAIGAEAFALLDDNFSGGQRNLKAPSPMATARPSRTPPQAFPCHYKSQQAYFVQQVPAKKTDMVIDCYQAANMYGGALLVDYPKRKPARKDVDRTLFATDDKFVMERTILLLTVILLRTDKVGCLLLMNKVVADR